MSDTKRKLPNYVRSGLKTRARKMRNLPTEAEGILWKSLRKRQLGGYRFMRQHRIDVYIVDFYCRVAKLVIEVDGEIHEKQKAYDVIRDEMLTSMGYNVLRFSNKEVIENIEEVKARIFKSCTNR